MKECDKHRRILLLSQSGDCEGLEDALKDALNADTVIGDILHQKTGDGLLHVAARGGHVTCIQLLLDLGVGVDQRNLEFKTPLHEAAQFGHSEAVLRLLRTGAQVSTDQSEACILTIDQSGGQPQEGRLDTIDAGRHQAWEHGECQVVLS